MTDNIEIDGNLVIKEEINAQSESIRVLVRIRPLNQDEIQNAGNNSSILSYDNQSLTLRNSESKKQFQCTFDAVLGPTSTQEDVYQAIQVCTTSVKDGFNRYLVNICEFNMIKHNICLWSNWEWEDTHDVWPSKCHKL